MRLVLAVGTAVLLVAGGGEAVRTALGGGERAAVARTAVHAAGAAGLLAWLLLRDRRLRREAACAVAAAQSTGDAALCTRPDGTIRWWNAAAERIYGWTAGEASGRNVEDLLASEDRRALRDALERAAAGQSVADLGMTQRRRDGTLVEVSCHFTPLRGGGGRVEGVCVVGRDVASARRTESALRALEARWREVLDSPAVLLAAWDAAGRLTDASAAFLDLAGLPRDGAARGEVRWQDLFPHRARDAATPDDASDGGAAASGATLRRAELVRRDGTRAPVAVSVAQRPDGSRTSLVRDLTESDALERRARDAEGRAEASQRLDAVGRLAGGIAHDFNNLLTVVIGYADVLLRELPEGRPERDAVRQIAGAAERAGELTQGLLAFSRKQVLAPAELDLNAVLRASFPMFERVLGEDVTLDARLAEGRLHVRADRARLDQAFLNLIVNARDAMPRGGRLVVEARAVEDAACAAAGERGTGRWVEVSFADTGTGMTDDVRRRVFEPFFTTKPPGKGTGLGLATVHGTILQSGGSVTLDSEVGRGTTFRIRLPEVRPSGEPMSTTASVRAGSVPGATVLVVEDADDVRKLTVVALEGHGFHVLTAPDGPAGLTTAKLHRGPIDALVTDVVMPGMNGREFADRFRAIRPGAAVVFVSGYAEDDVLQRGLDPRTGRFVRKPYRSGDLASAVAAAIERARRQTAAPPVPATH